MRIYYRREEEIAFGFSRKYHYKTSTHSAKKLQLLD
jgi:hypothetical protein